MVPAAPRVLVADDEEQTRYLVAALLHDAFGAEVDAVADGRAAIRALAAGSYDLVVLDLKMPGADGFAVLRWTTSRPPGSRVPVLAVTGAADADREEALRLGAAACVAKPFDLDELVAAARSLMSRTG